MTQGMLLAEEMSRDPEFRKEWEETAFARVVAAQLISYRVDQGLSQRALADRCGFKQPFIAMLESGERNPKLETLIALSGATGIEWTLDIRHADAKPQLVSKKFVEKHQTFQRDGACMTVASATATI
jgi:transcriptional regulator with XRE-family HTH domain